MALMVRMSLADICLIGHLIDKHMKENNIKNIEDIDEQIIQKRYDEIMNKKMWENPADF